MNGTQERGTHGALLDHAVLVRRIARGILGDAHEVEDAQQETFAQLLTGIGGFESRGSLEGWIRRVAVRTCLRIARRRRWWGWLMTTDVPAKAVAQSDPEGAERLYAALDRLSPRERTAFVMKYQEDLSYADVAEAMGCAEATARHYAFRASRKLKRLLGDA